MPGIPEASSDTEALAAVKTFQGIIRKKDLRKMTQDYPKAVYVGRYRNSWQIRRNKDYLDYDILVEDPVAYVREDIAHQRQKEAEARGAADGCGGQ